MNERGMTRGLMLNAQDAPLSSAGEPPDVWFLQMSSRERSLAMAWASEWTHFGNAQSCRLHRVANLIPLGTKLPRKARISWALVR